MTGSPLSTKYDAPENREELADINRAHIANFLDAYRGRIQVLGMDNPFVLYNPRHIVRITLDAYGTKELEAMAHEAHRTIGFGLPNPDEEGG